MHISLAASRVRISLGWQFNVIEFSIIDNQHSIHVIALVTQQKTDFVRQTHPLEGDLSVEQRLFVLYCTDPCVSVLFE